MPGLSEGGSEDSSDGQNVQKEIQSLQHETRIKRQQLAAIAANCDQKWGDIEQLRADERHLQKKHLQSMKSLMRSKDEHARRDRLKAWLMVHLKLQLNNLMMILYFVLVYLNYLSQQWPHPMLLSLSLNQIC